MKRRLKHYRTRSWINQNENGYRCYWKGYKGRNRTSLIMVYADKIEN